MEAFRSICTFTSPSRRSHGETAPRVATSAPARRALCLGGGAAGLTFRSQKRRRDASRSPFLAAAEVSPVEGMTSPSYPSKRGTSGHRLRPWATSQSARAAGAGWASALRQSRAQPRHDFIVHVVHERRGRGHQTRPSPASAGPMNGRGQAEPITRTSRAGTLGKVVPGSVRGSASIAAIPTRRDDLFTSAPLTGGSASPAGSPLPIRMREGKLLGRRRSAVVF
jgi:hypothetical protein